MLSQPVAFALLTDNVVKPLEEAIIKDHVLEFVPGLSQLKQPLDFAARACKLDRDGSSTGRLCPSSVYLRPHLFCCLTATLPRLGRSHLKGD